MSHASEVIERDSQRDYYDNYWKSHPVNLNPDEVIRLARILEAIGRLMPMFPDRKLRICDLGCGRGWLSAELAKFGAVTAVDQSQAGVDAAAQRWPEVRFLVADILTWRPEESFDLVVSSEVIEHVPDHQEFADTVHHLLRDGGFLVLTTPNGNVQAAWDEGGQGRQIIENWLTPAGLRRLFARFEVLNHKVFILDFSYNRIFRVTSAPKLLALLKKLRLIGFYDFMREQLGLGLYQIYVGRLPFKNK